LSEPDLCLKHFEPFLEKIQHGWPILVRKIKFVYDDLNTADKFSPVLSWYYANAVLSFLTGNFVASISTSSACVEIAINMDERMQDLRGPMQNWLHLNPKNLKKAKERGLPIDKLLIKDDDLEKPSVAFIDRRNKFDHGEIYLPSSPTGGPPLLIVRGKKHTTIRPSFHIWTMPLQQLMSAHGFLVALYLQRAS